MGAKTSAASFPPMNARHRPKPSPPPPPDSRPDARPPAGALPGSGSLLYAPTGSLEDRSQRGERVPPPVDAYSPRGDPYRSGGVSSAPDAPAPQRAGGKELRPLDPSTGATKYAWG